MEDFNTHIKQAFLINSQMWQWLIEVRIVPGIGMYPRIHVKLIFINHKSGTEIVLLKLFRCLRAAPWVAMFFHSVTYWLVHVSFNMLAELYRKDRIVFFNLKQVIRFPSNTTTLFRKMTTCFGLKILNI